MKNLTVGFALAASLFTAKVRADQPAGPAWTNPSYGAWHSSVMGGGGFLLNAITCPSDPRRMYVYGDMDGLSRSDDAGKSWRIIHGAMDIKESHYEFAGLTVNPHNADQIAVACGGQNGPRQGVFLSDDGGKTWTKTLEARFMGNGPYRWAGSRIAGSWDQGGRLVTATAGSGVWRSENGGRSWYDCGLPGIYFTAVTLDRTDPERIWLCAAPTQLDSGEFKDLKGGLYRSDDGGKNWTKLADESPFEITQDPLQAGVLYGLGDKGVLRSLDLGVSWQEFSVGLPTGPENHLGNQPFRALGTGPNFTLVVQNDTKMIYRLESGKSQWQAIKPTFNLTGWRLGFVAPPAMDASSIVVSRADPNHWYLTDEFGIYQSADAGKTWTPSNQGIETTVIHTLAQDPRETSTVYLGAGDVGFWVSSDAATVLTQTDSSTAGWVGNIKCIDASAKLPSRVYAVGGVGWKLDRIFLSTDHGKSVSPLPMQGNGLPPAPFSCDSIAVDPADPNSVTLATSAPTTESAGGIYHSSDGGNSWAWMSRGLPLGKQVFQDNIWWGGRELAQGPDGTLLAVSASCNGVYRFDKGSQTWSALDLAHRGGLYSVVADPLTPGRFYVCVVGAESPLQPGEGGLFRTDDDGASWTKILTGSVHALACDQGVKHRLIASNTEGLFLSLDAGDSWSVLEKLPNHGAYECLAFAGDRVVVGSAGNGAFWADLREVKMTPVR